MRRRLPLPCLVLATLLGATSGAAAHAAAARPITVSYVSANAVYLDAGRAEGVTQGAHYRLVRSGETVAEIEVAFLAEHSASGRVVRQSLEVRPGDVAQALAAASTAANGKAPATDGQPTTSTQVPATAAEPAPTPKPVLYDGSQWQSPTPGRTRVSGTLSAGTQQFRGNDASALGYNESATRLSLFARNIDGLPLDLNVRMRSRQDTPTGFAGSLASETTQRLYEASLTYNPPEGRFAFQLGRIAASPFVGLPYLDGAIAQVRLVSHFYSGLFFGKRPEIENLSLHTSGQRYGLFVRYSDQPLDRPRYSEVALAVVGDYLNAHQLDREYVSLESRFGNGARWSLYERAEVDLNRDYRLRLAGRSVELSNVIVATSWMLSDVARLSLSYDRRHNVPTADNNRNPEDVFIDLLNDGASATFCLGKPTGLNASLTAGLRRESASNLPAGVPLPPATRSYGLSVFHNDVLGWRLLVGADAEIYQGGIAEGHLVTLRVRKFLPGGHDFGLMLGQSVVQIAGFGGRQRTQWARLSGTFELPWRLYVLSEIEYGTGGSLGGRRWLLELGYRF